MWNAISLVQDMNSCRCVHFLRRKPLHHGHLHHWNTFIARIFYKPRKNICFLAIQSGSKLCSVPGSNKGLSSSFWWLGGTNHMKFTEECVIRTEKRVLVKKMFTNWLHIGFPLQVLVENIVHGAETDNHMTMQGNDNRQIKKNYNETLKV